MKRAIIDIGTNTTHLLIAEVNEGQLKEVLFKERHYTFLGDGGLDIINEEAIKRLNNALEQFAKSLKSYDCNQVQVIATEGLRSASNGNEIYQRINTQYGWPIDIISGIYESQLIYEGVRASLDLTIGSYLIMDIGGGSVEFILVDSGIKIHQWSFPIGISSLYESYHRDDPIQDNQLLKMNEDLDVTLKEFWATIHSLSTPPDLIGCAGTFEIFLTEQEINNHRLLNKTIKSQRVTHLFSLVRHADQTERSLIKELPKERSQYIVVALALMIYVLKRLDSTPFIVSKYALKEGAISSNEYFLD